MAAQPPPTQPSEPTGNPTKDEPNTNGAYSFVVRHSALKGYQAASLVTPPGYVAYALYKKRLTLPRLMRVSWIGATGGYVIGGLLAVARLRGATEESIVDRATRLQYNETQIRVDGLSMMGQWITALVAPALFWRHGRFIDLALGGATLGASAGVYAHLWMSTKDGESIRPIGMEDTIAPEKK